MCRGGQVREALVQVLRAHNAEVTQHFVPVAHRDRDAAGATGDPRIVAQLRAVVADLA